MFSSVEYNESRLIIDLLQKADSETEEYDTDDENSTNDQSSIKKIDESQVPTSSVELDSETSKRDLFKEIYFNKSSKTLNIDICFKLQDLISQNKMDLDDLDNSNLIEALKSLDETNLDNIDKFVNEQHANQKLDIQMLIVHLKNLKLENSIHNQPTKIGPNLHRLKQILQQTGYSMEISKSSRVYGGPPPNRILDLMRSENSNKIDSNSNSYSSSIHGLSPLVGCECFIGRIPLNLFEDELIPLFEKQGNIWDLRIITDPTTGLNKGYAFITYCDKQSAEQAVKNLNNYEIRLGTRLLVRLNKSKLKLFVRSIPKHKSISSVKQEFMNVLDGIVNIIMPEADAPPYQNRGYCFLEFIDSRTALLSLMQLGSPKMFIMQNTQLHAEWCKEDFQEYDQEMAQVKTLFVRIIGQDISDEVLKEIFKDYNQLTYIKRMRDFAFLYFNERGQAVKAMNEQNLKTIGNSKLEIKLARPFTNGLEKKPSFISMQSSTIPNVIQPLMGLNNSQETNQNSILGALTMISELSNTLAINKAMGIELNQLNSQIESKTLKKRKLDVNEFENDVSPKKAAFQNQNFYDRANKENENVSKSKVFRDQVSWD